MRVPPMQPNKIDHLVVTAPTLESGADFVRRSLGIALSPGGKHPRMATHNLLARLGDGLFLEVIAIDPDAPDPLRPRWFGLDAVAGDATPRLATWVVRTQDIATASARSTYVTGPIQNQSRGHREWRITIADDGSMPMQGLAPALIQWGDPDHPANSLPDLGLRLESIALVHPQPAVVDLMLDGLQIASGVKLLSQQNAGMPCLVAHIRTASGIRTLA